MKRRNNILQTPRRRRRRKEVYIWRTIILSIFFLIVSGITIGFFHLPFLQVREVAVTGTNEVDPALILEKVSSHSSGSYYLVIPKTFILLYPQKQIKEDVLASFHDIDSVEVKIRNFIDIEIAVRERETFAQYCIADCFVFDNTGYIYKQAASSSEQYVTFRDARPEYASSSPLGTYPLRSEIFKEVESFSKNLAPIGLHLEEVVIGVNDTINIRTREGNLIVSYREPLAEQLDILRTALGEPLFRYPDGAIRSFNYIDLRFGKKIFYRLEGEMRDFSLATSTASSTE